MSHVTITLCLPHQVREQFSPETGGDTLTRAIYDALCGQFCWAVVQYELGPGSRGCASLHFRLEGLGLPSMVREGFDREPPPGIVFEPYFTGALVPVLASGDAPALAGPAGRSAGSEGP